MKFLTNSKALHEALSKADFESVFVADVSVKDNVLTITFSNFKIAEVVVESLGEPFKASQLEGWRWVAQTLGEVSEQPVIVGIKESSLTLTFEYYGKRITADYCGLFGAKM